MEKNKQTWFLIIKNFPYLAITIFFFYPGVTKKEFFLSILLPFEQNGVEKKEKYQLWDIV